MPKWRKLYVKTVESLDMNDMPDDFCRLLWVLLPLGLDREGRALDNVARVRSLLFPLRTDVTLDEIGAALDWLAGRGMIRRYVVKGRPYFCVPTWRSYQGNTAKEAPSEYPAPPEDKVCVVNESGASPEKVETGSGAREATDSDRDADTDTDVEAKGEGAGETANAASGAPDPAPRQEGHSVVQEHRAALQGAVSADHPAIVLLKRISRRRPPRELWDECVRVLGDAPNETHLQACWLEWRKRGYNPANMAWLFEWYVRGIPEVGRAAARAAPPGRPAGVFGDDALALFRQAAHPGKGCGSAGHETPARVCSSAAGGVQDGRVIEMKGEADGINQSGG